MKTINKLKEAVEFLESRGIEAPEKEAEIFVREGLDIDTVKTYRDNPELSEEQVRNLEYMLERRVRREPLQYILGYEEFMDLKLLVGPGVLIPRPETEFMAEQAIKTVTRDKLSETSKNKYSSLFPRPLSLNILDLCTGSGCLALALAKEFPDSEIYGTDISEIAVEYARRNSEINRIRNATFLTGSLFQPFKKIDTGCYLPFGFDMIISNPPYIRTEDIKTLQPEIKNWEPSVALDGGTDGLDFYRELIPAAKYFLKEGGLIMLELGIGQSGEVEDIIESSGYSHIETIKDYAGIERIIQAKCRR
jgi:release factor glutamine methyltransferase